MDIPEQITTTLTIDKLGATDAKRGTQMINVFIPEIGIAKYSTTMFVPMEVSANLKADDVFTATISRGKLKNNKSGDWANEYYWDYGATEVEIVSSDWRVEPPAAPMPPAAPRPTDDDRQSKIMLQHASGVVGPAYGDWRRLDPSTRGSFSDYLKAIAMGATWYLKHVYIPTGYNPQPEPVEEVEEVKPNDPWDQAVDA
jgi:hypothetical protein